ncbi:hypothetical protein [Pacificibacter maritimus]|nr:hypothetical protein [Pacificibacter maritimus]
MLKSYLWFAGIGQNQGMYFQSETLKFIEKTSSQYELVIMLPRRAAKSP